LYVIELKAEKDKQDALNKKIEQRLNALEKQQEPKYLKRRNS